MAVRWSKRRIPRRSSPRPSPIARGNSCPRSFLTEEATMKRGFVVLLALALLTSPLGPAFAQSPTLDKIKEAGVLTIGTRTGSPPFAYINRNNEWVGFSIDLVELLVIPSVSREVGRPVKLEKKESTPPTRIPLLTNNSVDLIAGTMTDTPQRRESVDFSLTFF